MEVTPVKYDQFILFGDSLTQQSCDQEHGFAFMPALQNAFIRRLDVINRGFSGYNSAQAVSVMPLFMPDPKCLRVCYIMIFFGANDACLPDSPTGQHVPLPEYRTNIRKLIELARTRAAAIRIILVTPPPVNEYQLEPSDPTTDQLTRTAEFTKLYADTCRDAGLEEAGDDLVVYNLWRSMMDKAGWRCGTPPIGSRERPDNALLNEWLTDGLHFTPKGYRFLYEGIMSLMTKKWPDSDPEGIPFVTPPWRDIEESLRKRLTY